MGWWRRKVWDPLVALLRQGASPAGLAWSVAVGLALGAIPLWGTSTVLCLAAAALFRLNPVAMQVANYLAYPLQLALILPFIRLGERLFGTAPLPLSLAQLQAAVRLDPWAAFGSLWHSLWHAAVAWVLVVPLPVALLAFGLTRVFRVATARFPGPPDER